MTTIPLHRVRASLTWLIAEASRCPVTIARNGRAVAVVVSPERVADGGQITSDLRAMLRADLLHALALLDSAGHPGE